MKEEIQILPLGGLGQHYRIDENSHDYHGGQCKIHDNLRIRFEAVQFKYEATKTEDYQCYY